MALTAIRPLTRHDYERLPETGPRYELIRGQLILAPAPNRYHQEVSKNLEFILHRHVKANSLGKVYDAPFDVYLSEHDVVQPDLLFVSNARPDVLTDKGAEGAPDLVIEILSPATERRDRTVKRDLYCEGGAAEYWLVDPDAKSIEVFLLTGTDSGKPRRVYLLDEDKNMTSDLFPGLEISLKEIFSDE